MNPDFWGIGEFGFLDAFASSNNSYRIYVFKNGFDDPRELLTDGTAISKFYIVQNKWSLKVRDEQVPRARFFVTNPKGPYSGTYGLYRCL